MRWFGWIRAALNWRVGLLALGLVLVVEEAAINRYWYAFPPDSAPRRIDRWTGNVERWTIPRGSWRWPNGIYEDSVYIQPRGSWSR